MKLQTLDSAGIAARVPHSGSMCLLQRLCAWTSTSIECSAISHRDPANPLRAQGQLLATNGIEYAAQAMALHGALNAELDAVAAPGFLASVRAVTLHVPRLDDVAGELRIVATRLAGDSGQAIYSFSLHDDRGLVLLDGRATVVLNALP